MKTSLLIMAACIGSRFGGGICSQGDSHFGRTLGKNGRDYVVRELDYRALAMWYLEVCRME